MAPPSQNWQRLLQVQPRDIDIDNDSPDGENDKLGDCFTKVRF